jgi:hypothetical protein
VLLFLATGGLIVAPDVPRAVKVLVTIAWVGLAIYVALIKLRPRWLDKPVFEVLLNAGFSGHARAVLVRIPHIAALVAFQFTALHAFKVRVPLVDALATLPVIFLVAVLPISIQGLGTTQTTMVYFLARYAPGGLAEQETKVIAASLTAQAIAFGFQALLGVVCLRSRVGRALQASAKESQVEPPAPAPGT